jgi:hypothetical protein
MFLGVMQRAYNRFIMLDRDSSRDAVDPLLKTATMMTKAYEKIEAIEKSEAWQKSSDLNSQEWMLQLYKESVEDTARKHLEAANERLKQLGDTEGLDSEIDFNNIEGIEELGVNYIEEEQESDENEGEQ